MKFDRIALSYLLISYLIIFSFSRRITRTKDDITRNYKTASFIKSFADKLTNGGCNGYVTKEISVANPLIESYIIAKPISDIPEEMKAKVQKVFLLFGEHPRELVAGQTGYKFLEVGWIQSENQLIGVSPDGITECEKIGCEIKCPEAKEHLRTCLANEIPLKHIDQCIHNFFVNPKLEKFYFMSYRPESIKPMFVKFLTRESLVNIGTEAKPVLKTINQVIELHTVAVKELEIKIEQSINKLKF